MKLTFIAKSDIPAGSYDAEDLAVGTVDLTGDTIQLSFDVSSNSTPVSPPPPPPVSPPLPPLPNNTPPTSFSPPAVAASTGNNVIVVTATDASGVSWTASASRGTDPTKPGAYCWMQNSNGDWHPGLTVHFYDDCLLIGARRMSSPYDYVGFKLSVTRNGQPVTLDASSNSDGTVDFWRGCAYTVRWLACDADWSLFNAQLFPDYPNLPQTLYNDSKYDYSFNGLGCASVRGMGTTGDRGDIGFLPVWDVGTVCNRDAASWAISRKATDHCGNWNQIAFVDDATGEIIDITTYPWACLLSAAQRSASHPGPVALYAGQMRGTVVTPPTSLWDTGVCPNSPNSAHLTRYAALTAMLTGSAHDKDLADVWANYPLMDANAIYYQERGLIIGAQRRLAWSLASIFLAANVGFKQSYFQGQLNRNLGLLNAYPKNQFHALSTDDGYSHSANGVTVGYSGMAMWQQSYFCDVVATIAKTQSGWEPIRDEYCQWALDQVNSPWAMLATLYVYVCFLADGKTLLTSLHDVQEQTWLTAGFDSSEVTQLFAAQTVQDVYNVVIAKNARLNSTWGGKCVNNVADFADYIGSVTDYAAEMRMVVIDAYNAGLAGSDTALAYVQNLPTVLDFSRNRKFDRLPKVAA